MYDWFVTIADSRGIALDNLSFHEIDCNQLLNYLTGLIKDGSISNMFGGAIGFASSIFGGIINLLMGIAISIHVLVQKEKIAKFFSRFVKAYGGEKTSSHIFEVVFITNSAFRSFLTGQIMEAMLLGVLCFIGMTMFKFPFALAVSAIISLTSLVPILGAWIGGIIGSVLALTVSPMKSVLFILFIIILQQLENNLIYPRVVGKSMKLPGILVLVAILVGGNNAGVLGMLLSVPICAVLYTFVNQSISKKLGQIGG